MKICACVILYNPSDDIRNIISYPYFIEKLYFIDNSAINNLDKIKKYCTFNYEYVPFYENMGIAYALKLACDKAINDGFDFILTMDQDSIFPKNNEEEIFTYLLRDDIKDYGILGLNYNSKTTEKKIIDCKYWLTSGNFINLTNYKLINGFDERLFIDYVDIEIAEQFNKINKKIGYINHISLKHKIGNPIKINIFGLKFTCMNHSPIRYYYRYRNSRYLYRKNHKFYRSKYLHDLYVETLKMLLFEKNKINKLRMIILGRRDAKSKKLGKYIGE